MKMEHITKETFLLTKFLGIIVRFKTLRMYAPKTKNCKKQQNQNFLTGLFMRVSFQMGKDMEKGYTLGRMVLNMKDNLKMIKSMDLESWNIPIVENTKGNEVWTFYMAKLRSVQGISSLKQEKWIWSVQIFQRNNILWRICQWVESWYCCPNVIQSSPKISKQEEGLQIE
ncbi:unnamed protein product (macronuclear) [Paramecium tetraurelia]|uniref:Uncharacterized protein n=1 Tax=Paramecium tetraurelia TaxID=5888 RepID=A0DR84_PARTE|nr:uncharacterized protein GSPATT00019268001 [Paramecium tetraurelia]CAK85551.1 unnamed protein product [Paramecium tetraurelia]|eukprot:XP_001452948.1 hypothetical protein (macronuclear) [Paramecium tetraurelia strain d4-2]